MILRRFSPLFVLLFSLCALQGCNRDEISMGHPEYARQITDGGDPYKGRERIMNYGCAGCHTIRGVPDADATVGPPLDRLAHRTYIAGVMKNTPDNMIAWIQNAPGVDEKTAMPNLHVTREDAKDIASYLYTLK